MRCREEYVSNPTHDYCHECFMELQDEEEDFTTEDSFEEDLHNNKIYTVYIMFYANKEKIGYTADLNPRIIEIKRKYPNNELVYFREFTKESEARRFEAWLKKLSTRELMKFISTFQDKIKKIKDI